MKVLILNGSPHPDGNTAIGLREAEKELQAAGMETEWVTVGRPGHPRVHRLRLLQESWTVRLSRHRQ